MTKWILGIIIVVVVGAGVYYYSQNSPRTLPPIFPSDQVTPPPADQTQSPAVTEPGPSTTPSAALQSFDISGKSFEFSRKEIRVKKGTKVKINFSSTGGFHDWVVDEFKVTTGRVNTGGAASVEFIADKTGTFEYYCSVGTHRQMGMKGTLIVE